MPLSTAQKDRKDSDRIRAKGQARAEAGPERQEHSCTEATGRASQCLWGLVAVGLLEIKRVTAAKATFASSTVHGETRVTFIPDGLGAAGHGANGAGKHAGRQRPGRRWSRQGPMVTFWRRMNSIGRSSTGGHDPAVSADVSLHTTYKTTLRVIRSIF